MVGVATDLAVGEGLYWCKENRFLMLFSIIDELWGQDVVVVAINMEIVFLGL